MSRPTPAQALRALSLVHREPVELVSIRKGAAAVTATVRRPDGSVTDWRIGTFDAPGLQLLADADRARVRSALATLSRPDGGPPNAA